VLVGEKKIAGILTEATGSGQKVDYVVIGIGLNVNTTPKGLVRGATSLRREKHEAFSVDLILQQILEEFGNSYNEVKHHA